MPADREFVLDYARALRRRATWLVVVRAASGAFGTGALLLAAVAAATGPVVTPTRAHTSLALVAIGALAVLFALVRPIRLYRGTGVHRLLAPIVPDLASPLRSALELNDAAPASASPALVAAHAVSVGRAIARVPKSRIVGAASLRHPSVGLGVTAALAAALLFTTERVAEGARALRHPARVEPDGLRVAPIVSTLHARLVYPSYLEQPDAETDDVTELAVPRGTSVELTVHTRIPAERGVVRLGATELRLARAGAGLSGSFVAREDAAIEIRVESDGRAYADPRPRSLRILEDASPTVVLESPASDLVAKPDDSITLRFRAADDVGLSSLDLVSQIAGTPENRRRLWSSLEAAEATKAHSDEITVTPAGLGAREGDVLLLWIEAEDGDVVSGPKRAVSRVLSVEIASSARDAALRAPELRVLLDRAIDLLGDRLENPVPDLPDDANRRFDALRARTEGWVEALRVYAKAVESDRDRVDAMAVATSRLIVREAALHGASPAKRPARERVDAEIVTQHEGDVLALADLLAQALVDEARAITNDLAKLGEEMRRLLEALREAPNEETRRALLAEIARAERRLMELARNMAKLETRVPSDFINEEAIERSQSTDALQAMRDAIERGDLEAALHELDRLSGELDRIAEHVDSGGARFRESRFGARDAAMGEARRQLSMLADAQDELSQRSNERLDALGERAGAPGTDGARAEALKSAAEAVERELGRMRRDGLDAADERLLDEAQARARDTSDALRTGDLGEARRNASRTGSSLEPLATGQREQAEMFPGHDGETTQNAEAAGRALDRVRDLERAIAGAAPDLDALASESDRGRMREDARAQEALRDRAEALERSFESGPDGQPLSPRAGQSLRDATQRMRRAEQALERGSAQEGALAQEEAGRELRELAEKLAGEQQRGDEPQRSEQEGGDGGLLEGPVRIPGADEFQGPLERRKALLEAMREGSPPGFEKAVDRYYEELLR